MPQYRYQVKKGPGDPVVGTLEAESQRAALGQLRNMGYVPISIEEYEGSDDKDSLRDALVRIKLKDKNIFWRQLANLFDSGMVLTRALTTLIAQTQNPKMKKVCEQIREDVQKGSTFAESLDAHPTVFSPMYVSLVRAGETGGMLDEVMWRIVNFGEQEEELRGKAVSAMVYPAFLAVMGTAAVFILVSFVFPKFTTIFEDFDVQLPWPTLVVMGVCDFMASFWWFVLLMLGLFAAGVVKWYRTEEGRFSFDTNILKFPVLGKVVQKYQMSQFSRVLGTLLDNGVPVLSSLRITSDTLTNKAIAAELSGVHDRVSEGDSISASLQHTQHFPPVVISMFAVGEESGRLGAVTKRMADAFDNEVDRAVKAMTSLFEPIMIVIMGVIVGFLVIAMLLPMLTLSSSVG